MQLGVVALLAGYWHAFMVSSLSITIGDFSLSILDDWKSTSKLIEAEGYPTENHCIVTSDGYILNVHRIPNGKTGKKNNKVALLVHGLFLTSSDWILLGAGKSLGYILADEGYDVWLLNTRGNVYSRNHTTLNPDTDAQFWNFSWHEVGVTDVPDAVDYILEATGADGIYFVGHSQGTTDFFVMASMKPDYNSKIKASVHLAPIAYMNQTRGVVRTAASFKEPLMAAFEKLGVHEVVSNTSTISTQLRKVCSTEEGAKLCLLGLYTLCGYSPNQSNVSLIPLIMSHTPAGASAKQVFHYLQLIETGNFSQYDLGHEDNLEKYGTATPPEYNLTRISSPVYFFYGANDLMTGVEDVENLFEKIPGGVEKVLMSDELWNHVDFIYGNSILELNNKIVDIFSKH